MMYRLKVGALSPRFGIDSPLKMCFFPLGIKEMVLWVIGRSYFRTNVVSIFDVT